MGGLLWRLNYNVMYPTHVMLSSVCIIEPAINYFKSILSPFYVVYHEYNPDFPIPAIPTISVRMIRLVCIAYPLDFIGRVMDMGGICSMDTHMCTCEHGHTGPNLYANTLQYVRMCAPTHTCTHTHHHHHHMYAESYSHNTETL